MYSTITKTALVVIIFITFTTIAFAQSDALSADVTDISNNQGHSAESIPYRDDTIYSKEGFAHLFLAIGLGISLIMLSAWGIKKLYRKLPLENTKTKCIKLIEMRRITPKMTVMIIEANNKTYILGLNNEHIIKIDAYDISESENSNAQAEECNSK